MRSSLALVLSLSCLALTACGDGSTAAPATEAGHLGGPCNDDARCEGDLHCVNNACVALSDCVPGACEDTPSSHCELVEDQPRCLCDAGYRAVDGVCSNAVASAFTFEDLRGVESGATDSRGHWFLAGRDLTTEKQWLAEVDAAGALLSQRVLSPDDLGYEQNVWLATGSDDAVFLATTRATALATGDIIIARLEPDLSSTPIGAWSGEPDENGLDRPDEVHAIRLSPQGLLYVAGETGWQMAPSMLTDSNDALPVLLQFDRAPGGPAQELAAARWAWEGSELRRARWQDIAAHADGDVWVPGVVDSATTGLQERLLVGRFDPEGNARWVSQWLTSGEVYEPRISVDSDGNAYVGGSVWGNLAGTGGDLGGFVMQVRPDGAQGWMQRGLGNEVSALDMGPDGRLFAVACMAFEDASDQGAFRVMELDRAGGSTLGAVTIEGNRTDHPLVVEARAGGDLTVVADLKSGLEGTSITRLSL